ncbi:hypothetical protein H8R18_03370 [Nanchangia anserum]|uniref:Ferritin-like domain-containing protein n=1 Tax=Nanchangia anserum TaxID=2692125 RepID=A0A8I0GG27_9ACTO|nr:ferritin-like fold-containing protein [Nanchangia anserum]MBD3690177.1 hypothetical protein [Nanchangia anserum]QOX82368.1 hypothetical protein H8R18_03370 [Nanchangia anserum]
MDKELIGLGAYLCVNAHGRLVKDSQLAPSMVQQIELARIADRAWQAFEFLEKAGEADGHDIITLMRPSHGLVNHLEERLRPSDWWDRVAKTYVSLGMMGDLWWLLAERMGETEGMSDDVRHAWGHTEWARDLISAGDVNEPTLHARLSLWGRRVLGDVLSTAMAAVSGYPGLAGIVDAEREDIIHTLTEAHTRRMREAGLKG